MNLERAKKAGEISVEIEKLKKFLDAIDKKHDTEYVSFSFYYESTLLLSVSESFDFTDKQIIDGIKKVINSRHGELLKELEQL
jgi:hypothetical protein